MTTEDRIYLDNAATSWPKPSSVCDAVDAYLRHIGAPAGRGAYREAGDIDQRIEGVRRDVAHLIDAPDPHTVVFAGSGTDALHLALHGAIGAGDHVVTTVCEHNSVLRPLDAMQTHLNIRVTRVPCSKEGRVAVRDIQKALRDDTRLVIMIHASNVTGAVQPVAEVGALLRNHNAWFLVDAAQTIGSLPLSVRELAADMLCAPGHKGLLGPLGTGVMYLRPGMERHLRCVRAGGTGTQSHQDRQPESMPDKYESGNLNVPGIVGLGEGVRFVTARGVSNIHQHVCRLCDRLVRSLRQIDGVEIVGPDDRQGCVGVVSIRVRGFDPQEVAAMIDATHRVQVRAGFHCAPRMHIALSTADQGGTIRFSPGPWTTLQQVDVASEAIDELVHSMSRPGYERLASRDK